jgi:hypothetical protein
MTTTTGSPSFVGGAAARRSSFPGVAEGGGSLSHNLSRIKSIKSAKPNPKPESSWDEKHSSTPSGTNNTSFSRCNVCLEDFQDKDDGAQEHQQRLPVQSSVCAHFMCLVCLKKLQIHKYGAGHASSLKWIDCVVCRRKKAFNADAPIVSLVICDYISASSGHNRCQNTSENIYWIKLRVLKDNDHQSLEGQRHVDVWWPAVKYADWDDLIRHEAYFKIHPQTRRRAFVKYAKETMVDPAKRTCAIFFPLNGGLTGYHLAWDLPQETESKEFVSNYVACSSWLDSGYDSSSAEQSDIIQAKWKWKSALEAAISRLESRLEDNNNIMSHTAWQTTSSSSSFTFTLRRLCIGSMVISSPGCLEISPEGGGSATLSFFSGSGAGKVRCSVRVPLTCCGGLEDMLYGFKDELTTGFSEARDGSSAEVFSFLIMRINPSSEGLHPFQNYLSLEYSWQTRTPAEFARQFVVCELSSGEDFRSQIDAMKCVNPYLSSYLSDDDSKVSTWNEAKEFCHYLLADSSR